MRQSLVSTFFCVAALWLVTPCDAWASGPVSRNAFFGQAAAAVTVVAAPQLANADVSDGTSLPPGMQQFQRILRLRSDIKV